MGDMSMGTALSAIGGMNQGGGDAPELAAVPGAMPAQLPGGYGGQAQAAPLNVNMMDALFGEALAPGSGLPGSVDQVTSEEYINELFQQEGSGEGEVVANKPTHRNMLGKIADTVLAAYGEKPVYESRMTALDYQKAMEGFTQDPLNTIRNIGRIPGMEDKALDLYGKQRDDERADIVAQRQQEALNEQRRGVIASILGSAKDDASFPKARDLAVRYATRHNMDPDELGIPTEYDPEGIQAWRYSAIDPKDQITLEDNEEYRGTRLNQFAQALGVDAAYKGTRLDQFERGLQETIRHNYVSEGVAQTKAQGGKPGGQTVQRVLDKNTREPVGSFSPDGRAMKMVRGSKIYYFSVTKPFSLDGAKLVSVRDTEAEEDE